MEKQVDGARWRRIGRASSGTMALATVCALMSLGLSKLARGEATTIEPFLLLVFVGLVAWVGLVAAVTAFLVIRARGGDA